MLRLIASDQSKLLGLPCFLGSRVCKLLRQKKKNIARILQNISS